MFSLKHPISGKSIPVTLSNAQVVARSCYEQDLPEEWVKAIKKFRAFGFNVTTFQKPVESPTYKANMTITSTKALAPSFTQDILRRNFKYTSDLYFKGLHVYTQMDKYSTSYYLISDNINLIEVFINQQLNLYAPAGYGTHYENVGLWKNQYVWFITHGNSSD